MFPILGLKEPWYLPNGKHIVLGKEAETTQNLPFPISSSKDVVIINGANDNLLPFMIAKIYFLGATLSLCLMVGLISTAQGTFPD